MMIYEHLDWAIQQRPDGTVTGGPVAPYEPGAQDNDP